ncbi:hypothetical protein M422DRAFT_74490 [Sphaerobolus stellatus SS14]|nr:hypothetical protein M422DRAFT_74490 [Sphaerobolus stellatus SS14]
MRNLSLLSASTLTVPATHPAHLIRCSTYDLDDNTTYIASEAKVDADVNVQVWKVDEDQTLIPFAEGVFPLSEPSTTAQVVLLSIAPETRTLCVILRCGDISILPLDGPPSATAMLDTIGTIEPTPILTATFSPDSSLLTIVSGPSSNPTLLLMDPTSFDVVSSSPIIIFNYGANAPINVGWGSKSTQFHGSLGKTAAQAPTAPDKLTTTPDDDAQPKISWRGDGQYFAVSVSQPQSPLQPKRVVRVYNGEGQLQNTMEDVPGLEHPLAWRPNGGLIAATQRFGKVPGLTGEEQSQWALGKGKEGRHDVVFFERNGLRHGEFGLREPVTKGSIALKWGYMIKALDWNADSTVLSVWLETEGEDTVQLWTTGNYHWYLKLEIPATAASSSTTFTSVSWHPEDPSILYLSQNQSLSVMKFTSGTTTSSLPSPSDTGLTPVVDGHTLLLTPFRTQNVPPPMSSYRLDLPWKSPPIAIALASDSEGTAEPTDIVAVLTITGNVALYAITTHTKPVKGKRVALSVDLLWSGSIREDNRPPYRDISVRRSGSSFVVSVISDGQYGYDVLTSVIIRKEREFWSRVVDEDARVELAPSRESRFVRNAVVGDVQGEEQQQDAFLVADEQGNISACSKSSTQILTLPQPSPFVTRVSIAPPRSDSPSSTCLFISLSSTTLSATLQHPEETETSPSIKLTPACSSYITAGSYLIYTTTSPAHESAYISLSSLASLLAKSSEESIALSEEVQKELGIERRKVERGARIVTAVPSMMSLVLQMPRGNLESIMPRPLVLERVRGDIKADDYRSAFLACRKHRVDLNLLITLDQSKFEANIPEFVEQVDDVEYINVFLSNLGRSTLPGETITKLCDGIRVELERRDLKKYINTILTAHVVKTPPALEAGLSVLLKLRDTNPEIIDDAVKYIIFLVDSDRLFDTALGMYDFKLVLLVAQYSQKDPREYLPFLRSLSSVTPPSYQKFKIDDSLRRYGKAVGHLHECSSEGGSDSEKYYEEAKKYVEKHKLFDEAVELWKGENESGRYQGMLELMGDEMAERREWAMAALAYIQAGRTRKAMVAYEKALQWQELFDLVLGESISGDELEEIARRVADDLDSKQRHTDAARVLLDYANDVDGGVNALVKGSAWSEARRTAALNKREDLLTEVIMPSTLDARMAMSEEIAEITELLEKQVNRLDELARKKAEEPDAFYGNDDPSLANIDVMTDVSNPGTMFTRYTIAPSSMSDRSRRTSRSKRKIVRNAGRKGTVEEEEYLLKSLTKLVGRLEIVQNDARTLLPHLTTLSPIHTSEAITLTFELSTLELSMHASSERIWSERAEALAAPERSEIPGEMKNGPKLIEKVPKPPVKVGGWKIRWIDTLPAE